MTEPLNSNSATTPVADKAAKMTNATKPGQARQLPKITVAILLQALKRKWLPALLLGLLLATLAGLILWFVVPLAHPMVYARLRIIEKMSGNWIDHPDPPLQRQTILTLLKDPLTLTAAIRRPDVAQLSIIREQAEPEEWLQKELRVDFPSGPEILQISMSGDRPQELKTIVNAVREVYMQSYGDGYMKERQDRLKRLEDHASKNKAEIERLNEQMRKNAVAGRDVDKDTIALKQKLAMQLLEDTKKDITKTQSDLRRYRTELRVAQNEAAQPINGSSILIDDLLDQHPLLQNMMQRRFELQTLRDKTREAAPGNPRVAKLETELQENQKQIDQKKIELRPTVLAEVQKKYQSDRLAFQENLKSRIKSLEEQEKTLNEDANRLLKQSTDLSTNTVQIAEEQRQIQLLETVQGRMAVAIESLKAEVNAPGRIDRLGVEPTITTLDKYSNKLRFSIAGSIGALLFGLLLVAFLESRSRRIDSPEDVLYQFGMSVVGKVPAPPKRLRLSMSGADKEADEAAWQAVLTESVDAFRTQLLHTARRNSLQILMVCSADSGEGKTSLACHLALSLARSGLKTLLIDADLRNPTAHELFELPMEPGLSEIIRDQIPSDQAVKRTSAPGLWLLPAGNCNTRVIDLLAQDALKPVFSELRQDFDFIIVDTSPILPVADPLLIAQHTDGVIFSLMHQVSRVCSTRDALEKLNALNIQTLGAVMNGTKAYRGYNQRKYAYRTLNN